MSRRRLVALAALPLALVALVACVSTDPGLTASRTVNRETPSATLFPPTPVQPTGPAPAPTLSTSPAGRDPSLDPGRTMPVIDGVVDFGSRKRQRGYDGFLTAAIEDIEQFWNDEFRPLYGDDFRPLRKGVFAAYQRRPEPIPGCGERTTTFTDVRGNAFYCSLGDFIVYDDDDLIPAIVDELGASAVGVVMAHEFGHAVQQQAGEINQPVILKEQQADCFAGAWSAHIARGENDRFQFSDADVRAGLVAMIDVADPVTLAGTADPDAHGTGFDRVGAFQDGFNGGVERCKTFFTENRDLVNIPFRSGDLNQGDLPMDGDPNGVDIITLIPANLRLFWTERAEQLSGRPFTAPALVLYPDGGPHPACDGVDESAFANGVVFCAATNEVLLDRGTANRLRSDIGDMAVGYVISQAFSEAVQQHIDSPLSGEARVLASDCFTGAWAKEIVPDLNRTTAPTTPGGGTSPIGSDVELSAGDLDEAIKTALIRSDDTADTNLRGSAFEKIAAFRDGVLHGLPSCEARLQG